MLYVIFGAVFGVDARLNDADDDNDDDDDDDDSKGGADDAEKGYFTKDDALEDAFDDADVIGFEEDA